MRAIAARPVLVAFLLAAGSAGVAAGLTQSPSDDPGNFISVDAPVLALTHARVIDGTGAPARDNQTIVIRDGKIAGLGDAVAPPSGAMIIDLSGKSVIPGLVMLHEHLFYPTSPSVYAQLGESFLRLYLAGGVTAIRTAGSMNGIMDIRMAQAVKAGSLTGPSIDASGPYLDGPSDSLQTAALKDARDARRQVDYWSDMGATSFKAYMNLTRAELAATIDEAHRRGRKVTGHLCSVTYAEAADMGIDNLEHGFMPATDFVSDRRPDVCPGQEVGHDTIATLDAAGDPFGALVRKLVAHKIALTSTLTVFETFTPGRPIPPGLNVLVPELRLQVEYTLAQVASDRTSPYVKLLPKEMELERAFVRMGGWLVAGTDPSGYGGVIPGYANARQIELLVEAGFTPVEAIQISTLNGARYLNRDRQMGSIAVGKTADLVVINGDPSRNIADLRRVDTVFKEGVGYDPVRLLDSVRGQVGLW